MAAPIPFLFRCEDDLVHTGLLRMSQYETPCHDRPWLHQDIKVILTEDEPITCLGCLACSSEDTILVKAVTGRMSSTASNLTPKK